MAFHQKHIPSGTVRLTRRELRIASLMATGASNRQVAEDLFISPHTVAAHLGNMLRRVGASNRTELIARLYSMGVLRQGAWPPLPSDGPAPPAARAAAGSPRPAVAIRSTGPASAGPAPHGNEVPVAMTFDALDALREAGHPVDLLAVEQRSVLAGLSESEVAVLNSVKDRLEAAAGEVEGQELKLL